MAVGIYGSRTLATASIDDVDILYSFSPDRESLGDTQMQPMFPTITNGDFIKMIGADGVYKMRLPSSVFKELGFYTVLIKPKSFETTILDCSYIVSNDNNDVQVSKKGIIIPIIQFQSYSNLVGYQIEYFDNNGVKIKNLKRIITSADIVKISSNNTTVNQGAVSYVLDPNGTSIFLTVTPDEGSLVSRNQSVDIGQRNQRAVISNTFFDPTFLDIEMAEHNFDTLAIALYGNSTRDLETGILTYYKKDNTVYRQYNLLTRKKQFSHGNIDIREERTIINYNQDFAQISQGLTQ